MTQGEVIDLANKAKSVLDSPAYQGAYEATRASIIAQMEKLPMADTDGAEKLRLCLKLLHSVQANMITALNSGKIEQFRLDEEKKRKDNPFRSLFR